MERRNFVKNATIGALFLTLHPEFCLSSNNNNTKPSNSIRFDFIENIKLLTVRPLLEMRIFYNNKLGLPILEEKPNELTIQAGRSTITFVKIESDIEQPWYHFAFNIPENKILKARTWQLNRTELVPTPARLRDADFPNDVRHFRHWNAHSIFFYDPAGNLLEFIARHDLQNSEVGDFSSKDILNVSEIAFVVDDQESEAKQLGEKLGIGVYPKTANFTWAMGDENGLLLCIPKRIFGENTDNPKRFKVHKTEAKISGQYDKTYKFQGFPYEIQMTKK